MGEEPVKGSGNGMRKLISLLLILLTLCIPACAEYVTRLTPAPTQQTRPEVVLRPSEDEVKVYATPHMKAGIVGYIIVGGRQQVEVIGMQDGWYQVAFTSIYGTSRGWIPASFFEPVATPTPAPTPTPVPPLEVSAFVRNTAAGYRLNLRSSPSVGARSLGKYFTGTPVTLTGERMSGYAYVRIGNTYGWMDERFLTTDPYSFYSELPQVMVSTTGSGGYLREGPGSSYPSSARYPNGTAVTVLGIRDDEWYHVAVGGKIGYMSVTVLNNTFSWQYGMDSDSPAVSGGLSGADAVAYIHVSLGSTTYLKASDSASSRTVGYLYDGCPVNILSYTRTGWVYVRIGDLTGYVDLTYLSTQRPSQTGVSRIIRNSYGTGLNLRTLPDTGSQVIRLCPNYSTVIVMAELENGWCYVQYGSDMGYMMGQRLSER